MSIAGSMYSSTPVTATHCATGTTNIGRTSMCVNVTFAAVKIGCVSLTFKTLLMYKHLKTQSCTVKTCQCDLGHRPHCTVATMCDHLLVQNQ